MAVWALFENRTKEADHLNEIVEAHRYMEENRAKGKLGTLRVSDGIEAQGHGSDAELGILTALIRGSGES